MLNERQERFCLALVRDGLTAEQAYAQAGYRPSRSSAAQLQAKPHIQARIAELRKPAATAAGVTLAGHLESLARIRDDALANESYGPAVSAEIAIGKHSGVIAPDKREVSGPDGGPMQVQPVDPAEVARALVKEKRAKEGEAQ